MGSAVLGDQEQAGAFVDHVEKKTIADAAAADSGKRSSVRVVGHHRKGMTQAGLKPIPQADVQRARERGVAGYVDPSKISQTADSETQRSIGLGVTPVETDCAPLRVHRAGVVKGHPV